MTALDAPPLKAIKLRCQKPDCSDVGGDPRAVMVLMPVNVPAEASILGCWRCPRCKHENTVDVAELARLK